MWTVTAKFFSKSGLDCTGQNWVSNACVVHFLCWEWYLAWDLGRGRGPAMDWIVLGKSFEILLETETLQLMMIFCILYHALTLQLFLSELKSCLGCCRSQTLNHRLLKKYPSKKSQYTSYTDVCWFNKTLNRVETWSCYSHVFWSIRKTKLCEDLETKGFNCAIGLPCT